MMQALTGVLIGGWIMGMALLVIVALERWAIRREARRWNDEDENDDWKWGQ